MLLSRCHVHARSTASCGIDDGWSHRVPRIKPSSSRYRVYGLDLGDDLELRGLGVQGLRFRGARTGFG